MGGWQPYIWYGLAGLGAGALILAYRRLSLRLALRYRPGGRIILEWQTLGGLMTVAREMTLKNFIRRRGRFVMEVASATLLIWGRGPGGRVMASKKVHHTMPIEGNTWSGLRRQPGGRRGRGQAAEGAPGGGREPADGSAGKKGAPSPGGAAAAGGISALRTMVQGARWLHFSWVTTVGAGDAALTAKLAGALWAVKGSAAAALGKILGPLQNGPRLAVTPDYDGLAFTTAVDCILALRLRDIIRAAVQVAAERIRSMVPASAPGGAGGGRGSGGAAGGSGPSQHKGVAKWKGTPSKVS